MLLQIKGSVMDVIIQSVIERVNPSRERTTTGITSETTTKRTLARPNEQRRKMVRSGNGLRSFGLLNATSASIGGDAPSVYQGCVSKTMDGIAGSAMELVNQNAKPGEA